MIEHDTRGGPPNSTWLLCPINECPWRHQHTTPDQPMIGESMKAVMREAAEQDDRAARAHLAEHPVEDFLRTIAELRAQLAAKDVVPAG